MELNGARSDLGVFEDRFEYIHAELIPSFGLRKYGVTDRSGVITALLGIADLKDQLHHYKSTLYRAIYTGESGFTLSKFPIIYEESLRVMDLTPPTSQAASQQERRSIRPGVG